MQTIILLGGDCRTRYLDRLFKEKGYTTYCFGVDAPPDLTALRRALAKQYVPIILPLPVTKDGDGVQCPLINSTLPFDTLLQLTAAENTIYGGMLPKKLKELCLRKGVRAVEYYDEEVILKNAELTARGTLCVLQEYGIRLQEKPNIAVTGFGRVAKATLRALTAAGCTPTVAARNPEALKEASAMGYSVLPLPLFCADASAFDAVVNTVPARLFEEKELSCTKKTVCIVDVASAPFGVDFEAAKSLRRTAVKAQSLPGKYTPQAAAEVIGEKLIEDFRIREG